MELTFLGSGAAEGYPALACDCQNCRVARARGGPHLRKRSHALVDRALLIDLGPDLLWSAQEQRLELHRVGQVLLTHAHDDHLALFNLRCRGRRYLRGQVGEWEICGSDASLAAIAAEPDLAELGVRLRRVRPLEEFELGPYRVTALPARHDAGLEPLLYAVRGPAGALLYATDSGPWPPETWSGLERLGRAGARFGLVALDATHGLSPHDPERPPARHMNFDEAVWHAAALRERGLLHSRASLVAHHLSHNWVPPHDEAVALLAPRGLQVAYDGLVVAVPH
jgi:phosphoribosyl 1,2-cyclic phosphate phosphodiesterase